MLCLSHPPGYEPERRYIYDLILQGMLGLEFHTQTRKGREIILTAEGDPQEKQLILSDAFFQTPLEKWLGNTSLPFFPCSRWEVPVEELEVTLVNPSIPVLYGNQLRDETWWHSSPETIELGLDIFGGVFFQLTRYEEVVITVRDDQDRFPEQMSLAVREHFLDRPLVNEYAELLWACLKRLWPSLQRKERSFRVDLGHDVDVPLIADGRLWPEGLRGLAGDLLRRRKLALAVRRLRSIVAFRQGNLDADAGNTFDFMMDSSERIGLRSTFFFIADHPGGKIDGTYSLNDPWIRRLIGRIWQRGHSLGLHPSSRTHKDLGQLRKEFDCLRLTAGELGIEQECWGGRQHHLRWEAPTTWQIYHEAGLSYDATLTYPGSIGFRCGTCDAFPVFNVRTRCVLPLWEKPVVVMDQALLGDYRLPFDQAYQRISLLKERCRLFQGTFSLLWHNGWLILPREKAFYLDVLQG